MGVVSVIKASRKKNDHSRCVLKKLKWVGGKVMKSPPIEESLPRACAIAPALREREPEERKPVTREETTGKTRPAS